jgi:hypothetical protein
MRAQRGGRTTDEPNCTGIRPCRTYRAYTCRGQVLAMTVEVAGSPKPNLSILIEDGDKISRENIADWGKPFPFTEADLDELYFCINFLRVTVWYNQATAKDYPLRRVQTALKALEEDLPAFMTELHRLQSEATTGKTQRRCEAAIAEAQSFSQAVARMRVHVPDDIPPIHHKFQAWHDDALFLGYRIQQISGGGSLKSVSSPLIKFIRAALDLAVPLSSGRERTEDAVRQALANHPWRELLRSA